MNTKTSGLAFATDVYHRNKRKDSNQATMNNMGMERGRMRKEPDNSSSRKATAKIDRKTASAASTFRRGDDSPMKTPMIVTLTQNISLPIWRRTGPRTVSCDSTPHLLMLVHGVQPLQWSTVTISSRPARRRDALLPGRF